MERIFTPRVRTDPAGRALIAPCALRKLEASLSRSGFKAWVVPPEKLETVLRRVGARVVGISAHDPLGLDPVGYRL